MADEVELEDVFVVTSSWKTNQSAATRGDLLDLRRRADRVRDEWRRLGPGSPGSELSIAAVDKEDSRPVWVNRWGGAKTVAQALRGAVRR